MERSDVHLLKLAAEMTDHLPVRLVEPPGTTTNTVILQDASEFSCANLYGNEATDFDRYLVAAMNSVPSLLARLEAAEKVVQKSREHHYGGQVADAIDNYDRIVLIARVKAAS